MQNKLPSA